MRFSMGGVWILCIKSDKLFNTFAKGDSFRKEQFNDGYRDIDTESESGGYGHNRFRNEDTGAHNSYDCDDALKLTNGLLKTGLSVASNLFLEQTKNR